MIYCIFQWPGICADALHRTTPDQERLVCDMSRTADRMSLAHGIAPCIAPYAGKQVMTQYHNKIVRDRIPELIERSGRIANIETLSPDRFHEYLNDKLHEELTEYQASRNIDELIDIVEVIQAIADSEGTSWTEFEAMRDAKRAERGSFTRRIWLRSVQ